MAIIKRIVATIGERQAARWDRLGEPSPAWRWCMEHSWLATIAIAIPLAAVLALAFGVPPFSPLLLVIVLVAPIQPILEAQRRVYERRRDGQGSDDHS